MVISITIWNFSRSQMTKRTSPLNRLVKSSYHVELRDNKNFMSFEAPGVRCPMTACERHVMWQKSPTTCTHVTHVAD